jgi:hypothetical protein
MYSSSAVLGAKRLVGCGLVPCEGGRRWHWRWSTSTRHSRKVNLLSSIVIQEVTDCAGAWQLGVGKSGIDHLH